MKGLKQPLLIESQWHTKNIGLIIECGSLKVKDIRKNYLHYGNFKFRFPERGAKAICAQKEECGQYDPKRLGRKIAKSRKLF